MSEHHKSQNLGWLRAAVMGANDGIISTASLVLGVASASAATGEILTAGVAGLVAGAMSMAAGEYVSVSSQADAENADIEMERRELALNPEFELRELADTFVARGVEPATALAVAEQLSAKDALAAHAREEFGISEMTTARPLQAAVVSAITFAVGAAAPVLMVVVAPPAHLILLVLATTLVVLAVLGGLGAKVGGASVWRGIARVTFWGSVAMAVTSAIGYAFGAVV